MLGLRAGQSFSATRVSIFMVEVGQSKQRPSSDNSRQIFEKRTLVARTFTLCRIVQDFSLFHYLFDLIQIPLSLTKKPFSPFYDGSFVHFYCFKIIYYKNFSILTTFFSINFLSVLKC